MSQDWIGRTIAHYRVTAELGRGGMGEVYRATDSRLGRDVALKLLPAAFVADRERLSRFEREAQLLAQLNHPHIAQIYGLESSGDAHALVMELVEGDDLARRLAAGALPLEESLAIARQIAEALEAAHEKGIVHRDLKPQNVKVTADGRVKVLDFGLAKAMDPAGSAVGSGGPTALAHSPTLTLGATQLGLILGTAGYMAPEQAKGVAVDKRADVWAFGVVLYEMLTGARLFAGDSVPETLASVLKGDLDFGPLPASTPPALRSLLRRCLERNPKNRLHDIADARIVLDEVIAGRTDDAPPSPPVTSDSRRSAWPRVAAGIAGGLIVGALAAPWLSSSRAKSAPAAPTSRFAVGAPEGSAFQRGIAISPDGRRIAFAARRADGVVTLWIRAMDSLDAKELPGTEGGLLPFWAPDSRRLGFFAGRHLLWTDVEGGDPAMIAETGSTQDVRGAAWGADDTILFAPAFTGPLQSTTVRGGAPTPATKIAEGAPIGTHRFPSFLPDGRRFVFYASTGTGTEPGEIHLGRLGSLESKVLGAANSMAVWSPPGHLLFARGETLVAQRLDEKSEELVGPPHVLGLSTSGSLAVSGLRSFGASHEGTLVHRNDRRGASQLVWVDREGNDVEAVTDATSNWHYAPRLSPDGRFLVAARYDLAAAGLGQIWSFDLARGIASQITFDDGDNFVAVWLRPGSREVLYNSLRTTTTGGIFRVSLDRPGAERAWTGSKSGDFPGAVTPDGKRLLFARDARPGVSQIWSCAVDCTGEPTQLSERDAEEGSPDVSPDGRWLAYASTVNRKLEVFVRLLDGGGGVVRISKEGGEQPLWSADGRELFYVDATGHIVAVPIAPPRGGESEVRPGAPRVLFQARLEIGTDRQYDVSTDGGRFVLNRAVVDEKTPILVLQNWSALLPKGGS